VKYLHCPHPATTVDEDPLQLRRWDDVGGMALPKLLLYGSKHNIMVGCIDRSMERGEKKL
jgi:hypothetical protein